MFRRGITHARLVENRTALRNRYRNHRNSENYENWKDAARMTNESFEDDKQKFLEHKCQQAEEASQLNQSSRVYSIIRDISGKSTKNTAMLVNKQNGESPINKEDLLNPISTGLFRGSSELERGRKVLRTPSKYLKP